MINSTMSILTRWALRSPSRILSTPSVSKHLRILSTRPSSTPIPSHPTQATAFAEYLGYAGALPFLVGGVATAILHQPILAQSVQLYGATIISFLGGVHWGVALRNPTRVDFLYAVTPSLFGCSAALLHPPEGLPILAGGFAAAWMYDEVRFSKDGYWWYRRLRRPLSVTAIVGCVLAWRGVRREKDSGGKCLREADAVMVSTSVTETVHAEPEEEKEVKGEKM